MERPAVSASEQEKGHGDAHAVARGLGLREQLGTRVLLADALHEKAARFYAQVLGPVYARFDAIRIDLCKVIHHVMPFTCL